MIYSEFKIKVLSMMPGRTVLPGDEIVRDATFRALKRVAKETIPLRLRTTSNTSSILRKIGEDTLIRMPYEPYADDDDLDTDSALIDAVAYHVCSELEIQRKGHFLGYYDREILLNNERLIETDLDVCVGEEGSQPWV